MDRFERMKLFVRIVERGNFAAAAQDLRLARSTATEAIKQLERSVGSRLLERTTRHVATTLDGRAFYERCLAILADVEEAEAIFTDAQPRGLLRVDAHAFLSRTFLLPTLPEFLARHPLLELQLGQGDRLVDLVREGVDCAIRAGDVDDSTLVKRRLTSITEMTCASPSYLAKHGVPKTLRALDGHVCVGFISSRTGTTLPLEFMVDGKLTEIRLPSRVTVNNSETMTDLARLGFGLIQAPRYRLQADVEAGVLVEVLPKCPPSPTPLNILYPQNRHTSPRVRAFIDWVKPIFARADI